jgi:hypothetical protein
MGHAVVNGVAQGRHGAHREQAVPGLEQLGKKHLGIGDVPSGDSLLQLPDILRHRLHELVLHPGHRGHDRVGQLERGGRPEATGLDPLQRLPGLAQPDIGVDRRVVRAMDGHQVMPADELVQLDVVHMPAPAQLRRVQHDEDVVAVGVQLRHPVALASALDGQRGGT